MAIIAQARDGSYLSGCSLCGQRLSDPYFATMHFVVPDSDLERYADSAMHWDCYAKWPHRARFASHYFDTPFRRSDDEPGRSLWPTLFEEATVRVRYGVVVDEVQVLLRPTGSDFRIPRADWPSWLAGRWVDAPRHPVEHDALAAVVGRLAAVQLPEPLS